MATDAAICPRYEQAAMLLGRKWTGLVLRALMDGPKRFSNFGAQLPRMSDRLLSARLKELEAAGLIERVVRPTKPVAVEYRLSDKGRALRPVVDAIQCWADTWVAPAEPQHGGGQAPLPGTLEQA